MLWSGAGGGWFLEIGKVGRGGKSGHKPRARWEFFAGFPPAGQAWSSPVKPFFLKTDSDWSKIASAKSGRRHPDTILE